MTPIGIYRSRAKFPYDASRQGVVDREGSGGLIELEAGRGFEQALEDLGGFDRVWLVSLFHENPNWKPKVMPPRGPRVKRGVFATRSPYRPNPIGISCVRLLSVEGLRVTVQESDLLDGTPILDIKPYLPYADSFPDAKTGWLEGIEDRAFTVGFSASAQIKLVWLEANGVESMRGFLRSQLEYEPLDDERKRVRRNSQTTNRYRIAYRTWRADFEIDPDTSFVTVTDISSGYSSSDLESEDDRYRDKEIHRAFSTTFKARSSSSDY